jgi:outer membrane protein with beta-barrel domain
MAEEGGEAMLRKSSLLLAVFSLLLVAPMAHAAAGGWSISVGGGLAVPMGDFSNDTNGLDAAMGWGVSPAVDYMINDMFSLGVYGTFAGNNINKDDRDAFRTANSDPTFDVKYTQMGGGVRAKYWLPMQSSPIGVYLLAGGGMTNFKGKVESSDPLLVGDKSKSGFSGIGGIGGGYKIGDMATLGVEGDYNFVSLKKDDFGVSSAPSFGVKAVLTFMMKGAQGTK